MLGDNIICETACEQRMMDDIWPSFYLFCCVSELQFKTILDAKRENEGLDTGITYYTDMPHGFAMRGGTEAAVTAAADDAFQKGADFLKKHLQV